MFEVKDQFVNRHVGPTPDEISKMLKVIGKESLDSLINDTVPVKIRLKEKMKLDAPVTENVFLKDLKKLAAKNKIYRSFIGMGYYPTILPPVIQRNILENPGWYTQYTPYQAEISQGRLEALLNFQTMVSDLTGLPVANASLLDEGTAAAEAMIMLYNCRKTAKKSASTFFVADNVFPQTIDVLKTRSNPLGINLVVGKLEDLKLTDDIYGILVQYPDQNGEIVDYTALFKEADEKGVFKAVAADFLSLALIKSPGELGADIAVGSTQRFGVPMGYGGPHAAYFATKEEFKRQMPGRIIGISIDAQNKRALRMALQTREQHIKREHATSNICTAQVLLAIMAGMYAVYHGPEGIKAIAERVHALTGLAAAGIKEAGFTIVNKTYFDTLKIAVASAEEKEKIKKAAIAKEINLRYFEDNYVGLSVAEPFTSEDVADLISVFADVKGKKFGINDVDAASKKISAAIPDALKRTSKYLTHPVFNSYFSETEMMRYIKSLEKKDLSLTQSMISLGSCTMKLNAAAEMLGITWPEFGELHPFCPLDQAEGYHQMFAELEDQLCAVTGFDEVSFQPNSGAQGEYAGLMVIRAYHHAKGESHRNIILIPASAHGTNPASAVMAGGKVVVTKCDDKGNIDLADLKAKAEQYKDTLHSLMVTYPSTHGVFEEDIMEICDIIHKNGGLVYMDGANMNAQVGLTSPKTIGADVCHLNLHKTFAIPHGGGGPGMGPIAVTEELLPYLPGHTVVKYGTDKAFTAVSAAPWGSASVLVISYAYIKMMGSEGLTYATKLAILNANYLKARLESYYKPLYTGTKGCVAHELIFDCRNFKTSAGIEVEDIAKRLMDYGYHAPTVSFPVPGTLMVEPTESEALAELEKFCDAMIAIRKEIEEIEKGTAGKEDNVLKNAPHTAEVVVADDWKHSYSREKAAYPAPYVRNNKFWPGCGRVNNAYGDRNLVCTCPPVSEYEEN